MSNFANKQQVDNATSQHLWNCQPYVSTIQYYAPNQFKACTVYTPTPAPAVYGDNSHFRVKKYAGMFLPQSAWICHFFGFETFFVAAKIDQFVWRPMLQ